MTLSVLEGHSLLQASKCDILYFVFMARRAVPQHL